MAVGSFASLLLAVLVVPVRWRASTAASLLEVVNEGCRAVREALASLRLDLGERQVGPRLNQVWLVQPDDRSDATVAKADGLERIVQSMVRTS